MIEYSANEIMALSAGRLIQNGDILFAGTGLSMLAATVAKRIHAPEAVVFFETGGIDPSLAELPLAVADPRVMVGTSVNSGFLDALSLLGHKFGSDCAVRLVPSKFSTSYGLFSEIASR